jgi:hypothetical protein
MTLKKGIVLLGLFAALSYLPNTVEAKNDKKDILTDVVIASSTFSGGFSGTGGINLVDGCLSMNGSCVISSSRAGSFSTLMATGLATLSGGASTTNMSVEGQLSAGAISATNILSGSSIGIGTSTPGSVFAVNGVTNLTTATSTFYSTGGINLTGGCFAINGVCIGTATSLGVTTETAYNSIISSVLGSSAGHTNFSGGIGTGGSDSTGNAYNNALRVTNTGNLVNIGSMQGGEVLLTSAGTFSSKVDIPVSAGPNGIAVGDLNGDGRSDFAVTSKTSPNLTIFRNLGNGNFIPTTYPTASGPNFVAIGDLNGDSRADVAVTNSDSNSVSVFLNTNNYSLATKVDYPTGLQPRGLAIADINGDGKADLMAVNTSSASVSVLLNSGNGTFSTKTDYITGTNPEAVATGDVNGDGKADFAVTNNGSNSVSVFINTGNGIFGSKIDYATGSTPRDLIMADLNSDGRLDLAVVNNGGSGTVSVLLNNGDGTFPAIGVSYAVGIGPRGMAVADVNGDGKPDLAVANRTSTTVSILRNQGDGTFAPKVNYTAGTLSSKVALGDLNGDGKADMVVANETANTVSLYLNQAKPMFYANATNGNVGIATTSTSLYKLTVGGDIGATGFINLSTASAKYDIEHLTADDEVRILDDINTTPLATYHYNDEAESAPLHLGLIAEEAPEGVLSASGKGVDLYKLSTFALAGIKAQQKEIDKLKSALSNPITDTLSAVTSWVVEKLTTKEITTDTLNSNKICLKNICITEEQLQILLEKNGLMPAPETSTTDISTVKPTEITSSQVNPVDVSSTESVGEAENTLTNEGKNTTDNIKDSSSI